MVDRYKQALRLTSKSLRQTLPDAYQHAASLTICACIKQLSEYHDAKHIALYQSARGEINLNEIWTIASQQGKTCYFPALSQNKHLFFLPATPNTPFYKNRYLIAEPAISRAYQITPEKLDLIFLPVLAFDRKGTRLGMGGGYYDRTLHACTHPLLVGVAYEFQHLPFIEAQSWDVPLDMVITEKAVYSYR